MARLRTPARALLLRSLLLGSTLGIGIVAAPRDAEASGYLTARFGADHGTPAMPNGYAVYFNPAALGGTKGTTITGDVGVLLRYVKYTRTVDALSPSDPAYLQDADYVKSNTGNGTLLNLLALPFVGVNTDFGTQNLRGGYAFYIPFGGLATWDRDKNNVPGMPGSLDGPQRWHNISGQILAIYNTFALAYRFGDSGFSLGANFSPIIHNVKTVRARNVDGSDDTVHNGTLTEGRSLVEATGFNVNAALGLYYEVNKDLHLGLSYSAPPGFYSDTRMKGELRQQLGTASAEADGNGQKIDFFQTYPDILRFGGTYMFPNRKLEMRADFEYVRWSVFKRQCVVARGETCNVADDGKDLSGGKVILNIPRNWNDAIGVRVGPAYYLNERTELFGSLGMTTPAVPKTTIDASTIDAVRLYFTAGARFELSKHFAIAGSYNHIHFFNVDTKGENDQNLERFPARGPGGGDYNVSRSPSADGKYRSQIGFVNVNVAYTF